MIQGWAEYFIDAVGNPKWPTRDFNHGFDTGADFFDYSPPRDVQATELDIPSCNLPGLSPVISDEVNNELERYLATGGSEFDIQASLNFSFVDRDSASATGNEIETIFDSASEYQAETEPDLYAWSSSFPNADSDHNWEQGTDLCPHFPPCDTEAIELDTPPCDTDSTSINDAHHIQHDLRKPFIFPEPYTEQLSNYEPSTPAEPFFSCASYVDYFMPELLESDSKFCIPQDRVSESIVPTECLEPEDDPPSYQESISPSQSSFKRSSHRFKAEYMRNIILYIAVCWQFFFRALYGFTLVFSGFWRSHGELNTIHDSEHATEHEEAPDIAEHEFTELHVCNHNDTDVRGLVNIEILADVVKTMILWDFRGEILSTPLCGSTTRRARRLRVSVQLNVPTKRGNAVLNIFPPHSLHVNLRAFTCIVNSLYYLWHFMFWTPYLSHATHHLSNLEAIVILDAAADSDCAGD
ncbi:hypothetical protein B0H10DRAFT_2383362 [Mycena sp. CBHHK59/15]|nr:hypothetical protein B0H10DRAFT_2383362 [Mycena sp. CBHHK59/15]